MHKISVKTDFSETPGHRSPDDGPFSGEEFLEQVLRPAFVQAQAAKEILEVDLDGTPGYATSFLEASFGGLAREFPIEVVQKGITVVCVREPYLDSEIQAYILEARDKKK